MAILPPGKGDGVQVLTSGVPFSAEGLPREEGVRSYHPNRPFFSPEFLLGPYRQLIEGRRDIQEDFSQGHLTLRLQLPVPELTPPVTYDVFLLDEDNSLLSIRFGMSSLEEAQKSLRLALNLEPAALELVEIPVTFEMGKDQVASWHHMVIMRAAVSAQRQGLDCNDIVTQHHMLWSGEHAQDVFSGNPTLPVEFAYLQSRYAAPDLGFPVSDYTDLAFRQAFLRLHPNAEPLREKFIRFTPLVSSPLLALMTGALEVWAKDESLQYTGCFKPRGAFNKLKSELELRVRDFQGLTEEQIAAETAVDAASHGNHANGVAWAVKQLGFKGCLLDLPLHLQTQKKKIKKCLEQGAFVLLYGKNLDEAMKRAMAIQQEGLQKYLEGVAFLPANATEAEINHYIEEGRPVLLYGNPEMPADKSEIIRQAHNFTNKIVFVHTYDDAAVSVGQGTDAAETVGLMPQLIHAPNVIYAVGAGGCGKLAGDGTYLRRLNPQVRLVGANRRNRNDFARTVLKDNYDVKEAACEAAEEDTSADGIDVPRLGKTTSDQVRRLGNIETPLVTEDEINEAIVFSASHPWYNGQAKIIEGAPATVLASVLNGAVLNVEGSRLILSITGGNIDVARVDSLRKSLSWVSHDLEFYRFICGLRGLFRKSLQSSADPWIDLLNQYLKDSRTREELKNYQSLSSSLDESEKLRRLSLWLLKHAGGRSLYREEGQVKEGITFIPMSRWEEEGGRYHFIDVRPDAEREGSEGMIPGAEALPMDDDFHERLHGAEVNRSKPVLFICRNGVSACRAARIAKSLGFKDAAVLQGGMKGYNEYRLRQALTQAAGWMPVSQEPGNTCFQDEKNREFQLWLTQKGELVIRLRRGNPEGLEDVFARIAVEKALAPFSSWMLVDSQWRPLPTRRLQDVAALFHWWQPDCLEEAERAGVFTDDNGRQYQPFLDKEGKRFVLKIFDDNSGKKAPVLQIKQVVSSWTEDRLSWDALQKLKKKLMQSTGKAWKLEYSLVLSRPFGPGVLSPNAQPVLSPGVGTEPTISVPPVMQTSGGEGPIDPSKTQAVLSKKFKRTLYSSHSFRVQRPNLWASRLPNSGFFSGRTSPGLRMAGPVPMPAANVLTSSSLWFSSRFSPV